MSEENKKSGFHIHLGGLIILIIILLILFRVDIKSKIDSPQFQENISYMEDIWKNNIVIPIKEKVSYFLMHFTQKGFEKFQENLNENLLKVPTEEEINKYWE